MTTAAYDPGFWNNLAERYAAKPVDDPEAFERKIAITRSLMSPSDVVLDVGCGTGSLALILAPHARHVHGLDLSSEMLRIARGKASAQGIDNVTFHEGTVDECAGFEEGSLDGICAYSILHLVHDHDAVLDRIFALVKPGGFFVSSTVCLGESWKPFGIMLAVARWLGKAPMVKVIDKATIERSARRAGFVDITFPDVGAADVVGFMTARKPG